METLKTPNNMVQNNPFAWATVEIINGPYGKDVIRMIGALSVGALFVISISMVLGHTPSIGYGNLHLAL
jgi:hypothetical protein